MNIKYLRGITLIELMIVVSIVAILGAIAYPAYQSHTLRARYADAQVKLLEIMQEQRKYFTDNNEYTTALVDDLNYPNAGGGNDVESDQGAYVIVAAPCAGEVIAQCVVLTATPQFSAQVGAISFTYNSRNEKTPAAHW